MVFYWMRVGDGGEYESFDTLEEAVEELLEWAPGEYRHTRQLGIETEHYRGDNYVSLYRGDAEAQQVKNAQLNMADIEIVRRILGQANEDAS
jgi:hypothetical protein